jgi:hypothetical protein
VANLVANGRLQPAGGVQGANRGERVGRMVSIGGRGEDRRVDVNTVQILAGIGSADRKMHSPSYGLD